MDMQKQELNLQLVNIVQTIRNVALNLGMGKMTVTEGIAELDTAGIRNVPPKELQNVHGESPCFAKDINALVRRSPALFRLQTNAYNAIYENNKGLDVLIRKKYDTYKMSRDEIKSYVYDGCCIAANCFDAAKGYSFVTYAITRIRGTMQNAYNYTGSLVHVPVGQRGKIKLSQVREYDVYSEMAAPVDRQAETAMQLQDLVDDAKKAGYGRLVGANIMDIDTLLMTATHANPRKIKAWQTMGVETLAEYVRRRDDPMPMPNNYAMGNYIYHTANNYAMSNYVMQVARI